MAKEHILTLEMYDNYLAAGYSEKDARCAVYTLNASFNDFACKLDEFATKEDIDNLEARFEAKLDAKINMLIKLGGAMFLVFCVPLLQKIAVSVPDIINWISNL
jgi:hypothetical protein